MSLDLTHLNERKIYEREAGILMPVFSLPGKYGIGDLGIEAREFIDILHDSNQRLWAMLPNGQTGYGNSPYQSVSAFAGNPYFIAPDLLLREGLLQPNETIFDSGTCSTDIDYGKLFDNRYKMLRKAYNRWKSQGGQRSQEFLTFRYRNHNWLEDYAQYMTLKEINNYEPWYKWPSPLKYRDSRILNEVKKQNLDKIYYWEFIQHQFDKQFKQLHKYALEKGVKFVGDMPFYINHDSVDVWAHRELFNLNDDGSVRLFSGLPGPNGTNVRWGHPCYDWDKMHKDNYAWFAQRMQKNAELYDIIRIDHAVAFVHYFGIKEMESPGIWYDGPDMYKRSVTDIINDVACRKKMDIIVENLGNNNQRTHDLYDQLNWMGMRIFGYMIGDMRYGSRNIHIPCYYPQNVAAYTGTHDNETLLGIIAGKSKEELAYVKSYLRVYKKKDILWGAIDTLYKSSAAKVILPMQDVLGLGNESRVCYVDNFEKSWRWRMRDLKEFDVKIQNKLSGLTVLSARSQVQEHEIQTKGWKQIFNQAIMHRYGQGR